MFLVTEVLFGSLDGRGRKSFEKYEEADGRNRRHCNERVLRGYFLFIVQIEDIGFEDVRKFVLG